MAAQSSHRFAFSSICLFVRRSFVHTMATLPLICVLLCCSTISNEHLVFVQEHQKLLSKEVTMKLPKPFHRQKENYEEGVIYFYHFVDSAYIIVFQGSMVEFSIDKYQSKMVERKGERKTSVGVENNRYWRKDVYSDGVRVYYDDVPKRNKAVYDKVLDEIAFRQLRRDE